MKEYFFVNTSFYITDEEREREDKLEKASEFINGISRDYPDPVHIESVTQTQVNELVTIVILCSTIEERSND